MNSDNGDKTVVSRPAGEESHLCPVCGTSNALPALIQREYRCEKCRLELAYVDYAPNGAVRGIFGWLRPVGDTLAERYRIKSVLGKGGFGATYLVEDLRLNGKRRALKEVPELLFDEYETTLLSRLNHPSIPDIIDRSVAGGMVYLVLEFGGSRTLGSERKRQQGRIPQGQLLPWMRQLCEVLIYLHSQHPPIIHRDLKPDNILLDENERIMLIDFGIAKESMPSTMTRTLGRAATHGFSPPEQVMGTGTDERSDIYALGATFYALLTGQNPPAAHERVAGKDLVPPSQIVPELAPELEEAILRALSLNVNHRQQTVLEFSQTLDALAIAPLSRPLPGVEATERTVVVGQTTGATAARRPSIKLPSGRVAGPSRPIPSGGAAAQQPKIWLPLAVIALILAVLATAAYLLLVKPDAGLAPTAGLPQTVTPQVVAPPPVQPVPSAPAAAKLPEATSAPVTQPAAPAQPPWNQPPALPERTVSPVAPPTSAPAAGSAQEMLKGRKVDIEPEATPAAHPPAPVKPRVKPVARAPAPPVVEKKSPAKPAKEEPAWTIIPGGARRTD